MVAGVAGAYGVRRRRTEIGLLSARGVGPGGVALRAAGESALPVALGSQTAPPTRRTADATPPRPLARREYSPAGAVPPNIPENIP